MAKITLKGNEIETVGEVPANNTQAPDFNLTGTDLSDVNLKNYSDKFIILNIFPSLDTDVCAASVRRFNQEASNFKDTVVLCVSADLPFAHKRFCEVEGLSDVVSLSVFRAPEFGNNYGVTITTGPLKGLLSRAVAIIDKSGNVVYSEQVPEIAQEPDYEKALTVLSELNK